MEWHLVSPEISMAVLAIVVILLDLFIEEKRTVAIVSTIGLIVPLGFAASLWDENDMAMNNMLAVDNLPYSSSSFS